MSLFVVFISGKADYCMILNVCYIVWRQSETDVPVLTFPLLGKGRQWKVGREMCSLSQSLVYPSWTGLLLQAADMRAILKRRHPQLHLTISALTRLVRRSHLLILHHLRERHFSTEAVWKSELLYSMPFPSNVWADAVDCFLWALCCLRRILFFCLDASLVYIGDLLRLSFSVCI